MIDIIALICLCRINGANALARGKKKRQYQFLTVLLWFGFEFIGAMIGMLMWPDVLVDHTSLICASFVGVAFAFVGGFLSYKIAKTGPVVEQKNSFEWNSTPGSYTFNDNNIMNSELLNEPATVRIIDELGGDGSNQTYYYMNGQPVCALYPGMEAVLKTRYTKNIITIAKPECDRSDIKHSVRFIAADNGVIEIHSSGGEFIPELFKNYTSN